MRKIVLGATEYQLGNFTLKQVTVLTPLFQRFVGDDGKIQLTLRNTDDGAAVRTIVYEGVKSSGSAMGFADFENLTGVTLTQLMEAQRQIGYAVGFLAEETQKPGEGVAGDSERTESP